MSYRLIDGMVVEISFDGYLRSIVNTHQKWQEWYTPTDATGKDSSQVDRERPTFFDFGLMVQTVESPKAEQERESEGDREKKEKIERLPVLEGICKYAADHVLLVGRPGSGKSTALARLLLQEAENALEDKQAKIPVLVELRYLPSEANESSVCDRIVAFIHKHDPALDIDEAGIKQLLRQGRLLLLVDGVNELPSDRGRVMVNQFRELYQKTCPMIFTTRELSAGGDLGIAKRLEMQPLTEPQMQQFVMAYFPTQGERLLRQLSGRLREFGQTPLLLWMLCSLFQQSEQIPPNLGMVFRAFTVGYGDRIKQDVTLSKDSRAWWGRLLQYLAFKMTCGESLTELQVAISRREAEQFLVEFLRGKVEFADGCAVRWLEDLLKHHLIQISNDRIEFRHQLIQEYYAAEWLLGLLPSLSDARLRQGYLNYLKWTEPLALMLELVEGEEQAVRVVRLALEVDLRLGARLAGAVKYEFQERTVGLLLKEIDERKIPKLYAIELLGETRSDKASELLILDLKDSDDFVRRKAAELLVTIGCDKAVEPLILALKDSNHSVRREVAEALGKIGSDKAIESLILMLKSLDDEMNVNAVVALCKIGSDKVLEPLILSLNDPDYFVRRQAAEALGIIGSDKAVGSLILALNDHDYFVRREVAEALGKIGSDKAVESLMLALNDPDDFVREKAIEALGKIGSDKAVDPLIHSLKDSNFGVREKAIVALGKIGNDKAVRPLIRNLKASNYDSLRSSAVVALGKIGSDKAIVPLILSLKASSYYDSARENIAEALGEIGSDKAVDLLTLALKDSNFDVLRNVTEALVKIDSNKAVETLILTLKDSIDYVRRYAATALGKISSKKAVEPLILALNDSDYDVREGVAWALGKIGSDKAVKPLILALNDSNDGVRRNAARALGEIGSDQAVEPLILALNDSGYGIREGAARALGEIGSDQAVEPLILALNNSGYDVRQSAARALGKIGSDKAVESLVLALNDPDEFVRREAARALGEIGSDQAVEPLILALNDLGYGVSMDAEKALGKIGSDKAVEPLILALNDSDSFVRGNLARILDNISENDNNLPTLTQQLPHLLTLIPTKSSQQALSVITAIQARCKYYNYDIAQTPLQEKNNNDKVLSNPQGNIIHMTEIKTEIKNDFSNANFGGANIANLGGTVNEQKIVQKNEVPKQSLAEATKEVQDLLNQLAKTNPSEATIADTIQQEIKRNPTLKVRLVNALKTGGIEALKAIFNNPFVSIPVETIKGFLEAEE